MKFRHLFSFFMIVAIMSSCNKEEIGDNVLTNFVLKASVENSEASTRAGFDSGAKFYWSKNDKLGVTTTNCKTQFSALTLLEHLPCIVYIQGIMICQKKKALLMILTMEYF